MDVTVVKRDAEESASPVVLASASPRRRALLALLGVSFSVVASDIDESPHPGEPAEDLTRRLARSKALAVAGCAEPGDAVVLAADTVVVLDDAILNKPLDDAEALAMLDALRGRAHQVLTGLALAVNGDIAWTGVVGTTVWMRTYGADEVERYIRSGMPSDRAGAYGIQDADFRPVDRIDGCYANAMGLPICAVRRELAALDPGRRWGPNWSPPLPTMTDRSATSAGVVTEGDCGPLCEQARKL